MGSERHLESKRQSCLVTTQSHLPQMGSDRPWESKRQSCLATTQSRLQQMGSEQRLKSKRQPCLVNTQSHLRHNCHRLSAMQMMMTERSLMLVNNYHVLRDALLNLETKQIVKKDFDHNFELSFELLKEHF